MSDRQSACNQNLIDRRARAARTRAKYGDPEIVFLSELRDPDGGRTRLTELYLAMAEDSKSGLGGSLDL